DLDDASIAPDGSALLGGFGGATLIEHRDGRVLDRFRQRGHGLWSLDGSRVAIFGGTRLLVADAATGRVLRSLRPADGAMLPAAFSPDGRLLAFDRPTLRRNGRTRRFGVRILDVQTGRIRSLPGRWMFDMAWS